MLVVALEEERRRRAGPSVSYLEIVVSMVREPRSGQNAPEVGYAVRTITPAGSDRTDWYRMTSHEDTYTMAGPGEPWTD